MAETVAAMLPKAKGKKLKNASQPIFSEPHIREGKRSLCARGAKLPIAGFCEHTGSRSFVCDLAKKAYQL